MKFIDTIKLKLTLRKAKKTLLAHKKKADHLLDMIRTSAVTEENRKDVDGILNDLEGKLVVREDANYTCGEYYHGYLYVNICMMQDKPWYNPGRAVEKLTALAEKGDYMSMKTLSSLLHDESNPTVYDPVMANYWEKKLAGHTA